MNVVIVSLVVVIVILAFILVNSFTGADAHLAEILKLIVMIVAVTFLLQHFEVL